MKFTYDNLNYMNEIKKCFCVTLIVALIGYLFLNPVVAAAALGLGLILITCIFIRHANGYGYSIFIGERNLRITYQEKSAEFLWEDMVEIKSDEKNFKLRINNGRELILLKCVNDRDSFESCVLKKSREYQIPMKKDE